jgi:hypothetical protein
MIIQEPGKEESPVETMTRVNARAFGKLGGIDEEKESQIA